jgi:hypothetical protein
MTLRMSLGLALGGLCVLAAGAHVRNRLQRLNRDYSIARAQFENDRLHRQLALLERDAERLRRDLDGNRGLGGRAWDHNDYPDARRGLWKLTESGSQEVR